MLQARGRVEQTKTESPADRHTKHIKISRESQNIRVRIHPKKRDKGDEQGKSEKKLKYQARRSSLGVRKKAMRPGMKRNRTMH
jgi:hypothetical protein